MNAKKVMLETLMEDVIKFNVPIIKFGALKLIDALQLVLKVIRGMIIIKNVFRYVKKAKSGMASNAYVKVSVVLLDIFGVLYTKDVLLDVEQICNGMDIHVFVKKPFIKLMDNVCVLRAQSFKMGNVS